MSVGWIVACSSYVASPSRSIRWCAMPWDGQAGARSESRSQSTGGLGIGLSLVPSMVEMQGEESTRKRRAGKGATFTLHLRTASTERVARAANPVPLLPRSRGHVLVVDDNPNPRRAAGDAKSQRPLPLL